MLLSHTGNHQATIFSLRWEGLWVPQPCACHSTPRPQSDGHRISHENSTHIPKLRDGRTGWGKAIRAKGDLAAQEVSAQAAASVHQARGGGRRKAWLDPLLPTQPPPPAALYALHRGGSPDSEGVQPGLAAPFTGSASPCLLPDTMEVSPAGMCPQNPWLRQCRESWKRAAWRGDGSGSPNTWSASFSVLWEKSPSPSSPSSSSSHSPPLLQD